METSNDPLAAYFMDKTFTGFTFYSLFHFRSISLCPWHRKEITGLVFTTACTGQSVLENLPFSFSLLSRLLFFRHRKRNPFRVSPWGMSYGCLISFLPSSPHPKQSAFSPRAVLQTEQRTPELQLSTHQCGDCSPQAVVPHAAQYCAFLFPFSIVQQLNIANSCPTGDPQ